MSRLTDQELEEVLLDNGSKGDAYLLASEARSMATEIRERRAADLTAQDLEALQEIRAEIVEFGITDRRILNGTDAELEAADAKRRAVALAVLDKLLARGVSK